MIWHVVTRLGSLLVTSGKFWNFFSFWRCSGLGVCCKLFPAIAVNPQKQTQQTIELYRPLSTLIRFSNGIERWVIVFWHLVLNTTVNWWTFVSPHRHVAGHSNRITQPRCTSNHEPPDVCAATKPVEPSSTKLINGGHFMHSSQRGRTLSA
jgi:hypothetical protein